jgi:uncharacterized protein (TIGR03067 family)
VDDLQDFQGTWRAVWLAQDGRKRSAAEARRTNLTVAGKRYTFRLGDAVWSGTIAKADRWGNCGAVDFIAEGQATAGKTCLGIYVLGDGELSVCVAPPGRERPTSFAPRPGGGHSLYLLSRSKPSKERPVAEAAGETSNP